MQKVFLPDFDRRFTVEPASPTSAFVPMVGVDLELVLSEEHSRRVDNDSTVSFDGVRLQSFPPPRSVPTPCAAS